MCVLSLINSFINFYHKDHLTNISLKPVCLFIQQYFIQVENMACCEVVRRHYSLILNPISVIIFYIVPSYWSVFEFLNIL